MLVFLGIYVKCYLGVFKIVYIYKDIFKNIILVNFVIFVIFIICIIILCVVKECVNECFKYKLKILILIELIIVIVVIFVFFLLNLKEVFNVDVVGMILNIILVLVLFDMIDVFLYLGDCFVVVILIFFNIIVMVKICVKKYNYELNDN